MDTQLENNRSKLGVNEGEMGGKGRKRIGNPKTQNGRRITRN
jgi:hypothetical protein